MTNEINGLRGGRAPGLSDAPGTKKSTGNASSAANEPAAPATPASPSDRVSLSEPSARLLQLEKALANIPEVDRKRVDEVKQAIDQGTYEVDSEGVADKLLSLEKALERKK